jgi:C-terminal processing protease CtpA/Prc
MKRRVWLACVAIGLVAGSARGDEPEKKQRGVFQAERGGWMLGMFVGDEKGKPFPFVTDLDPQGEAKKRGVRAGDEIIRFQDEEVQDFPRMFADANKMRPGQRVKLWVRRGAQSIPIEFTVQKPKPVVDPAPGAAEAKADGDAGKSGEDGKKKKKRKRGPVVIKPIPVPGGN